ncbi:membrin-11-like [Andrographis paniculata]|uniref:membrin-11-like n=1 Tax=Andrographis paniculata TaxID=175694 RepID=UPI0021E97973|nr:membrin-11-like [Andrographis paniculata]XP_051114119.1 membrin-11-like [Andrographis paniculata]XP_051114120.1 membrin-11-like [Andrographis paniculata]
MAVESGGGGLSELYSSSKRLSIKIRDDLERLERLEYTSSASASASSLSSSSAVVGSSDDQGAAIRRDLNQIQSICVDMDRLWRSIASKPQRDLWKRKIEQVSEEADSFRASLDKYQLRQQKRIQEAQERAELLGRASGDSHVLRIFDDEAQAVESVRRSSRVLEESFATGVAILNKYSEQRDHLKRAQRKALDVVNTLGLSNSLLKLIERRSRVDKWIKYAGMVLTIVILIVFWRWTR